MGLCHKIPKVYLATAVKMFLKSFNQFKAAHETGSVLPPIALFIIH